MNIILIILLLLLLLLIKGFFSGSEIALVNSDKMKLQHKARQGHKGAQLVLKLFKTPDIMLGTTLVGTNIATVALTTIIATLAIELFGSMGDFIGFLIATPLLLIFGEIVPKSIYQQKSDEIAPIAVYPLRLFSWIFFPVIFVFSSFARLVARITVGGKSQQTVFMAREQIRSVVDMAERGTNVGTFDRERIKRTIRFGETTVAEAMIPIADVVAIKQNRDMEKAIQMVYSNGFNRLPVYQRNTSNIIGVLTLSTWDLMDPDLINQPIDDYVKPAKYVTTHQTIDHLLTELKERKDHMAVVVDEFGSAVGMITMEDILEEVVGEIDVGYDFEEYHPRKKRELEIIEGGGFVLDARLSLSEANEILGADLPIGKFHTLGGMLIARLKYIPVQGEKITANGFVFTVEDSTERMINRIRVEPEMPG
ncbi:MAG: HlyC/CorC family transporter [Gammaproteobacteria bacterium]|nr:HlyC/CorC family transporter [Gammaproteobacteria bacterium]